MESVWRIELLGGLRVSRGETAMTRFRMRKAAELLAFLAYHPRNAHPREVLIELLWPECDLPSGRHNLSMALSYLRQELHPEGADGDSPILADRQSVGLNRAAARTDVAEFEAAVVAASRASGAERALHLAAAVEAYGGDLLPGFYDDWVGPEQQRLDELFLQVLKQLIQEREAAGDLEAAICYALRGVCANPLREEAHREAIRLYLASGRRDDAVRQFRELERILRRDLDCEPAPETRALLAGGGGGGPAPRPAPPAAAATREATPAPAAPAPLEPVGGAVPLTSRYYVERPTDAEFRSAVARRDSIVLVKGSRQVGKTSLLARGLQQARGAGARVLRTHFQALNASQMDGPDSFLLALAEMIAVEADAEAAPAEVWKPRLGPNLNFSYYLRRHVLNPSRGHVVWGLDEVDRLFTCPFAGEVFGLFRSWHDERALEPDGPWSGFTLAIAYSTEAHLFITDVNQSPFNVGTRLTLNDFTGDQVAELNRRHGSPLRDEGELAAFHTLLGGHPYLVRRALHELAGRGMRFAAFRERAESDDWIFGEHLRRIVVLLRRDPELAQALLAVLSGRECPNHESFYRLRTAGVLSGESPASARPRCELYAGFLRPRLV
jgi:DNA-binding SARP family transcriptional activator